MKARRSGVFCADEGQAVVVRGVHLLRLRRARGDVAALRPGSWRGSAHCLTCSVGANGSLLCCSKSPGTAALCCVDTARGASLEEGITRRREHTARSLHETENRQGKGGSCSRHHRSHKSETLSEAE